MLRRQCDLAGSQAAWARANNLTPAYVSDTLAGHRGGDIIGAGILKALGIELTVNYRKIKAAPGRAVEAIDGEGMGP